jgi:hypothetical protein
MGERASAGSSRRAARSETPTDEIDPARGEAALRLVARMLGLAR